MAVAPDTVYFVLRLGVQEYFQMVHQAAPKPIHC